jgi:hypothetical protein
MTYILVSVGYWSPLLSRSWSLSVLLSSLVFFNVLGCITATPLGVYMLRLSFILMNYWFYYYEVTFIVSSDWFESEVHLSDKSIATFACFEHPLSWKIFSTFSL